MLGEHNRVNLPAQYLFSRKQGYYHRDVPIKINQISRLPERQIRIVSTARISPLPYVTIVCKVRCHYICLQAVPEGAENDKQRNSSNLL